MKKQFLGLSILLLAPGFVVASETTPAKDAERKEQQDKLATLLPQFAQHKSELASNEQQIKDLQGQVLALMLKTPTIKSEISKSDAAIRAEINAKWAERATLQGEIETLKKQPNGEKSQTWTLKQGKVTVLDGAIANAFKALGEQEPDESWFWRTLGYKKQQPKLAPTVPVTSKTEQETDSSDEVL